MLLGMNETFVVVFIFYRGVLFLANGLSHLTINKSFAIVWGQPIGWRIGGDRSFGGSDREEARNTGKKKKVARSFGIQIHSSSMGKNSKNLILRIFRIILSVFSLSVSHFYSNLLVTVPLTPVL